MPYSIDRDVAHNSNFSHCVIVRGDQICSRKNPVRPRRRKARNYARAGLIGWTQMHPGGAWPWVCGFCCVSQGPQSSDRRGRHTCRIEAKWFAFPASVLTLRTATTFDVRVSSTSVRKSDDDAVTFKVELGANPYDVGSALGFAESEPDPQQGPNHHGYATSFLKSFVPEVAMARSSTFSWAVPQGFWHRLTFL